MDELLRTGKRLAQDIAQKQDPLGPTANKLQEAEQLRRQKKHRQAKRICEDLLQEFPDYVGALHTLGLIFADMRQYEKSVTLLGKAAMFCPVDWRIYTALAGLNLELKRPDTAIANLEQAQKLSPGNIEIIATLAEVYRDQKEYELSARNFEMVLKHKKDDRSTKILLANCHEHLGNLSDACEIYESLIIDGQHNIDIIGALLQLPESLHSLDFNSVFSDIDELAVKDMYKLNYIKSIYNHRNNRYKEAWSELEEANEVKKVELSEKWRQGSAKREVLLNWAKSIPVFDNSVTSKEHPISLFVLGPSRSGKTTLEQLITCIPGVKRGYENPIVENCVRRTMQVSGCITRSGINGMPPNFDSVFLEFYWQEMNERARGSLVFTNTHPAKITEALRYAKTIPNSYFIFIKRNVEDIIFRIYMKNYASGNEYAYDVNTIKEYIEWYYEMIDICLEKLPKISVLVEYENMIADPKAIVEIAYNLCGLKGEPTEIPAIGDDRRIAEPYRRFINNAVGH